MPDEEWNDSPNEQNTQEHCWIEVAGCRAADSRFHGGSTTE